MKRGVWIGYLVALHLLAAALLWRTDTVRAWRGHPGKTYTQVIREAHDRMEWTAPDGAAVFLGDSITAGLATAAVEPASVNFGVGGQSSRELLATLPDLSRAGRVYLMIGANDRNGGVEPVYREIAAALPPLPVVWSAMIDVEQVRAVCGSLPDCTFVDASAIPTEDGVHPSPEGYRQWVALLQRVRQAGVEVAAQGVVLRQHVHPR